MRPLSPAALERILLQPAAVTARADTAAEYARVVARLEALLAAAGVPPGRVRALRRAAAFARLQAVLAHAPLDPHDPHDPHDPRDPRDPRDPTAP